MYIICINNPPKGHNYSCKKKKKKENTTYNDSYFIKVILSFWSTIDIYCKIIGEKIK